MKIPIDLPLGIRFNKIIQIIVTSIIYAWTKYPFWFETNVMKKRRFNSTQSQSNIKYLLPDLNSICLEELDLYNYDIYSDKRIFIYVCNT